MRTRQQVQQELAALDKTINDEIGRTRLPSLNAKHMNFPAAYWILAAVFVGLGVAGNEIPYVKDYHKDYGIYATGLGALIGLVGAFRTFQWFFKSPGKTDAQYVSATENVRDLQKQRAALQAELKSLSE